MSRLTALALVLGAGTAFAQEGGNDMPLDNEGDVLLLYSDPSVGAPTGTFPPDAAGDLYYQIYPGERVMHHTSPFHGPGAMEVDGFLEAIFDTDWCNGSTFYDRTLGPALPATACAENREPAFLQQGFTSEVLVSLGPVSFGGPCTLFPSFCSPSSSTCPPPGFVNGWGIDISLTAGIVVPADGTAASDLALTYFVPPGKSYAAGTGTCGLGDYPIQDTHSTDETQSDLVSCNPGSSEFGGSQLAGGGPIPDAVTSMMEGTLHFREAITNVVVDSGTGLGFEQSWSAGGATNALNVPAGSGQARIAVEHRANQHIGLPCFASMSWSGDGGGKLAPPGIPLGGANLMISPAGAVFGTVLAIWGTGAVTVDFAVPVLTEGIGDFQPLALTVPASAVGTELYVQSGVVRDDGSYAGTNVVTSRLGP